MLYLYKKCTHRILTRPSHRYVRTRKDGENARPMQSENSNMDLWERGVIFYCVKRINSTSKFTVPDAVWWTEYNDYWLQIIEIILFHQLMTGFPWGSFKGSQRHYGYSKHEYVFNETSSGKPGHVKSSELCCKMALIIGSENGYIKICNPTCVQSHHSPSNNIEPSVFKTRLYLFLECVNRCSFLHSKEVGFLLIIEAFQSHAADFL